MFFQLYQMLLIILSIKYYSVHTGFMVSHIIMLNLTLQVGHSKYR